MTYCAAVDVDGGIVFIADSRTTAGVDNLGTYSKLYRFFGDGDRSFFVVSAGNLATTQGVLTAVSRDVESGRQPNLATAVDLEEVAECFGAASIAEQRRYEEPGKDFSPEASFIVGGQIRGRPPGIYLVYPEGNFVRASDVAPFLQIGEIKYGKPILDRIIAPSTTIADATKCLLVSMDSTMRSNATVGPPIELLVYHDGSFSKGIHKTLNVDDPFLGGLRESWNKAMREAFDRMPEMDVGPAPATVSRIERD